MLKLVSHLLATRVYPHEPHLYLRRREIRWRRLRPHLRDPEKWQRLLDHVLWVERRLLAVWRKAWY